MTQTASVPRMSRSAPTTTVPLAAAATAVIAVALVVISFLTKTGSGSTGPGLAQNTWIEIILLATAVAVAAAVIVRGVAGPTHGGVAFVLFAAVAALTAASIAWSVSPDQSWVEASRTASYLAVFGTALALARLVPTQWRVPTHAIALASVALSAWAVLAKVLTSHLYDETFGRLQAPFSYWNATGLAAALGLPVVIWLGSRHGRSPVARALAVPGVVLLLSVVVLSYSRSAVAAAIVGTALPLAGGRIRLRSLLTLALGAVGAAIVCIWALKDHNLTSDVIPQAARVSAGHTFGIVMLAVLILAGIAGGVVGARVDRTRLSPPTRHRIGTVVWGLVALIPVLAVIALAASSRGLTGEVSHLWSRLTSTTATVGDSASRLEALASSRPDYWHQAMAVGDHHLLAGAGAGAFAVAHLRYPSATLAIADHAHSYLFQTYADFGLIGIALNLALLVAWIRSVGVTLQWWGADRPRPSPDSGDDDGDEGHEREALWALLGVVAAFAVSSAIDWTWFAPGVALPALVAAGWVAGRGPLSKPIGMVTGSARKFGARPGAILAITGLLALGITVAWETWQPLRSQNADNSALLAESAGNGSLALGDYQTAANAFPVSLTAIQYLAGFYNALGNDIAARREYVHGTVVQPDNACSWMYLGRYEYAHGEPAKAATALARASELNVTGTASVDCA